MYNKSGTNSTAICPTSHNPIEWAEVWFGYTCPTVIRKNRPQVWGDAISKRKPAIKVDCYRNNIKIERIPSQIFSNCSLFVLILEDSIKIDLNLTLET
jgi:hypothetical protein